MTKQTMASAEEKLRQFCRVPLYLSAGGLNQTESIYTAEKQLMQRALAKRKREFFSGRYLARQALARAGFPVGALPRGGLGSPIWPSPAVGSITHDQKYGAAVVAHQSDLQGIGIDLIEEPVRVDNEIAHMFMHPGEATMLRSAFPDLSATAVAFGVKESVVKALSNHIGRLMDLLEIHLAVHGNNLFARVEGTSSPIPCIVFVTEIGLLSASYFRHQA